MGRGKRRRKLQGESEGRKNYGDGKFGRKDKEEGGEEKNGEVREKRGRQGKGEGRGKGYER